MLTSQMTPLKPGAHRQVYSATPSIQVPLLAHVAVAQSSMSTSHRSPVKHSYIFIVFQKTGPVVGTSRGATMAEKLRGTKVWVPTPGRLRPAPGQRPGWVLGAAGGRPLPLWGSGGITPGKFLKTQMLNPAFWWLLCLFWKLRPRSWGTNTSVVKV